ncbi:MAG: hypothetical protein ACLUSV_00785 [Streptococcus sp.]
MLKKWSALFTVALNKGVLKEQIEEMEIWEKNGLYSRVYYSDFRFTDEFEKELSDLNLNNHKKVLEVRELIRYHKEINTRILEKHKEEQQRKHEEEMLNLPKRIDALEKELQEVKALLAREKSI